MQWSGWFLFFLWFQIPSVFFLNLKGSYKCTSYNSYYCHHHLPQLFCSLARSKYLSISSIFVWSFSSPPEKQNPRDDTFFSSCKFTQDLVVWPGLDDLERFGVDVSRSTKLWGPHQLGYDNRILISKPLTFKLNQKLEII